MDAERQRKMQYAQELIDKLPDTITSPVNINKAKNKPGEFWSVVLWNTRNDLTYLNTMITNLEKMVSTYEQENSI
ncbi:hypothetical protein [Lysinibacillus phage vB_LspM-01]|nr:hypothetical protein [Lysinibacillus phage vB_LspM-01]